MSLEERKQQEASWRSVRRVRRLSRFSVESSIADDEQETMPLPVRGPGLPEHDDEQCPVPLPVDGLRISKDEHDELPPPICGSPGVEPSLIDADEVRMQCPGKIRTCGAFNTLHVSHALAATESTSFSYHSRRSRAKRLSSEMEDDMRSKRASKQPWHERSECASYEVEEDLWAGLPCPTDNVSPNLYSVLSLQHPKATEIASDRAGNESAPLIRPSRGRDRAVEQYAAARLSRGLSSVRPSQW